MNIFSIRHYASRLALACIPVTTVVCAGCSQPDQIESYTVAKESPPTPVAPAAAADPTTATDRMLAAILPVGEQAWFFKAVGPIPVMDEHAQAITDFFSSVRVEDTGRVRWELPSGWKEDPASGMRAATLWVPADGKPIEISVTTLGWRGTKEDVLSNVNRWRGQMQLPPVDEAGLAESTRELTAGDQKITLADLRGTFQPSGMMGPFAGGGVGAASRAASEGNATAAIPPGHPPIGATSGPSSPSPQRTSEAASLPKFEVPQSWQQRSPANAMRKAEFGIADGTQQATVTLTDFPTDAGPSIAEPLPNVNRWRRDIGLTEITEDALSGVTEKIEIAAQPATYVRLMPDPQNAEQSQSSEATLAAMVTNGDRVWFIKMTGAKSLVAAQEEQFKSFLKSITFPAAGGANHGNQ
jgi:hypothetical protein